MPSICVADTCDNNYTTSLDIKLLTICRSLTLRRSEICAVNSVKHAQAADHGPQKRQTAWCSIQCARHAQKVRRQCTLLSWLRQPQGPDCHLPRERISNGHRKDANLEY